MADVLGHLKIRVVKGVNLAVRDALTSDPYIVITMGKQKVKTKVIKKSCNPVWNEDLTLQIRDPNEPINLTVYDKDMFSVDDKMGVADIDINPYIAALRMGLENLPNGCAIKKVQPDKTNCLADESCVVWNDGKITQEMNLRLKRVECGAVQVQLEWFEPRGCKGLGHDPSF